MKLCSFCRLGWVKNLRCKKVLIILGKLYTCVLFKGLCYQACICIRYTILRFAMCLHIKSHLVYSQVMWKRKICTTAMNIHKNVQESGTWYMSIDTMHATFTIQVFFSHYACLFKFSFLFFRILFQSFFPLFLVFPPPYFILHLLCTR